MSDSTIAKMIKELKAKIKELEQQLAESVAYGEQQHKSVDAAQNYMANFRFMCEQYSPNDSWRVGFERDFNVVKAANKTASPNQALVNKMKADAVREAVEALDPVASIRKLKSMAEVEGMAAYRHEVLDYAKQLEQAKT